MEPYQMKSSGVEWLGDVPEHWRVTRLKLIGKCIIGVTYKPENIIGSNDGTLVLRSSNIQNGRFCQKDCVYVDKSIPSKKQVMIQGDILICSRNGSRRLIGKNIKISANLEGETFGAFMTIFRTSYSDFVYYFLNSPIFEAQSGLYMSTTINQLTTKTLSSFSISLPPIKEQQAIADYLDQACNTIDQTIEVKKKQLEKLAAYRKSVIHEAVTKGLDKDVPMKPSGVEWLGDVPEHWKKSKLRYALKMQNGKLIKNDQLVDDGEYPVYGGNGIMAYTDKFNYTGSILILGRVGAKCGNIHLVNKTIWVSDNAIAVRTSCNYGYMYYLLTNMNLNHIASDTAQPLLVGNNVKKLYFSNPPISEQQAIANHLDQTCNTIDQSRQVIEKQVAKLAEYRKSLIHECVTGKKRIYQGEV